MGDAYGSHGLSKVADSDYLRDAVKAVPNANVEAVEAALSSLALMGSGSGERVACGGAADAALISVSVKGACEQDGEPTAEAPAPIRCARSANLLDPDEFVAVEGCSESIDDEGYVMPVVSDLPLVYGRYENSNWKLDLPAGTYTLSLEAKDMIYSSAPVYPHIITEQGDEPTELYHWLNIEEGEPSWSTTFELESDANVGVVVLARYASVRYQLEPGSETTPYVPGGRLGLCATKGDWRSAAFAPVGDLGLLGLPCGTADSLVVKQGGRAVITRRVGAIAIDGTESWLKYEEGRDYMSVSVRRSDVGKTSNGRYLHDNQSPAPGTQMCSHGVVPAGTPWGESEALAQVVDEDGIFTQLRIACEGAPYGSTEEMRAFFAASPMTVAYALDPDSYHDEELGMIEPPRASDGAVVEAFAEAKPEIEATWWAAPAQAVADCWDSLSALVRELSGAAAQAADEGGGE